MVRLRPLAVCALLAALLAGCGGGGSPSSSTTSSAVTQTLGTTTATTTTTRSRSRSSSSTATTSSSSTTTRTRTTTSRTTSTSRAPGSTHAQLGMALCERNVAQSNVLTGAEKSQLDALCRLAWNGHLTPAAFAAANRRLCVTMVRDSGLVGAAAKAAAQTCEQGG